MKYIQKIVLLLLLINSINTYSQDLHWSMFDMAPLAVNPAYTGDYDGSFRVGGNYRGQWNSVSNARGFKTSSIYADAPVLMVGRSSWLGIGGIMYNDNSGINQLKNLGLLGSVALHFGLSKKSILTLGFQGGYINRRLNNDNLLFEDQIVIGGPNLPFGENVNNGLLSGENNVNTTDLNIGLKYYAQINKTTDITMGVSGRHIAAGSNNFIEDNRTENIPLWISLHSRMNIGLNKKWSFSPNFIYQKMSTANQLNLQALLGYKFNKQKGPTIRFGLGYRAIDNAAIQAIVQINMKNYTVGLSYDLTLSELDSAANTGGIELAFAYTGSARKKSKVRSKVYCPRF